MMNIPLIEVNEDGEDAKGNCFGDIAADEVVAMGYMINRPVRLQYPDGSIVVTNEIRVTRKGVAWLDEIVPQELKYN